MTTRVRLLFSASLLCSITILAGPDCGVSNPVTQPIVNNPTKPEPVPVPTPTPVIDIGKILAAAPLPPSPNPPPEFRTFPAGQIGWKNTTVSSPLYAPTNPVDASTLVGTADYLSTYHANFPIYEREEVSLIGFDLSKLPQNHVTRVQLLLWPLNGNPSHGSVYARKVQGPWEENSLPNGVEPPYSGPWWTNPSGTPEPNKWLVLDITNFYQDWLEDPSSNYGLRLACSESSKGSLFASASHPQVNLRPQLIIWADYGPPRFCFPLDGAYSPSRIVNGGDFGDYPWREEYCLGNNNAPLLHTGIDLAANIGDSVYAAEDGKVAYVGSWGAGWASVVILEHYDLMTGRIYQTLYGHVDPQMFLKVGTVVNKGNLIAKVAYIANGTHLHFSGMWDGFDESPQDSAFGRAAPIACATDKHPEGENPFSYKNRRWDPKKMFLK